jgi:hypothetical protein
MTQSKQIKTVGGVGHWIRVAVMFLTFGMIFPHAMTEGMDIKP